MLFCEYCGKGLKENANFCSKCGKKVIKKVFCTGCGLELILDDDDKFCFNCGKEIKLPVLNPIPVTSGHGMGKFVGLSNSTPLEKTNPIGMIPDSLPNQVQGTEFVNIDKK